MIGIMMFIINDVKMYTSYSHYGHTT
jgi:hypothetical protein